MNQPQRNTSNDPLAGDILQWLSTTEYACSSLSRLEGGILNYVYRGALLRPRSDGTATVVVKHAEERMPGLEGYTLSTMRNHFEAEMIRGLPPAVSKYRTKGVEVVVPKAYLVDIPAIANTQVFEDFQGQLALRDILLSHSHDVEQSTELAVRLGSALGSWVRYLHIWGAQDSCPGKSRGGKLQEKHSVQESSFDFYYGNPLQKSAAFPDILGECEDMFLQIKQQAAADVALWPSKEGFGMIHGDLSTKNVLIQAEVELRRQKPRLVIIDWELAQLNSQLRDIAQLLADLFLLQYFEGAELAVSVMQGFLQGSHCSQPEELASLSVHVGLHLLLFDITLPGPYPTDRINHLVSLARDLVVAGWERDHQKLQLNEFWALLRTV